MILDITKSADDNFKKLLAITDETLKNAIAPFLQYWVCVELDFFELVKYDYDSLFVTTVHGVLDFLVDEYGKNLPKRVLIENMLHLNFSEATDDARNDKRIDRILEAYNERREKHAEYLNYPDYKPRMLVSDVGFYDVVSDVSILKRFLFDKEPIITKKFFDELKQAYEMINGKKGYEKFHIMHKLEKDSKLEMFYKVLSLIKKEKRRLKLNDSDVQKLIEKMQYLHIMSCEYAEICNIIDYYGNAEIYAEVICSLEGKKTVNNIVFNVDKLVEYYAQSPSGTAVFFWLLNFIHDAVVFHMSEKIASELLFETDMSGFEFVRSIQLCDASTEFFDNYLNSHNLVNLEKKCGKDITFTHFKKIYNIRREPPRK